VVGQKYFEGSKRAFWGQNTLNKINNNSENFRRGKMFPLSCGSGRMDESFVELGD